METDKISQTEIDQLKFEGDLIAPDYDFDVHGNLSSQFPGGAVALCFKKSLDNSDFFFFGGVSTTLQGKPGGGGGVGYQSPSFNAQLGSSYNSSIRDTRIDASLGWNF